MIILAGFMSILSEAFTAEWPERILNVHPSLIPAFCGKGFYGLQKAVEVLPDDTPQTLQRRVMEQAEWILLPQAAEMVAARLQAEKEGSRA